MQRRAAAVSAAVFLLIAAGAYSFVGVAEHPSVEVDADMELSQGETFTAGGTEYTVTSIDDGSASIEWTNESARYTQTFENGSTVPAAAVAWDGQRNRHTATLENGSTVAYQGGEFEVVVTSESSFVLANTTSNETEEFEVEDTLVYRGNETTVVGISEGTVSLAWGDPYLVRTADGAVTFRQQTNVTRLLLADEDAENELLTTDDGERFVRFTDGSTTPLADYLPEPDTATFETGEEMRYQGTTVTVASATEEEATVEWFAPRTNSLSPGEGENVTLGGTTYLAHFEGDRLVLSTDFAGYRESQSRIEGFEERIAGIWAVAIISGLAAVLLILMSYLPSRY